jgi:carbohydrate kinase (thermoresistant glucokinase family)
MVTGVSGAGKTTFGTALAQRMGWTFLECDVLHPPANVEKMRAGIPLTDADRAPWLDAVAERLRELSSAGRPAVVACSALKLAYRKKLKAACGAWLLIYLEARPEDTRIRLAERRGHYMPATLLDSQFATLEAPSSDEQPLILDAHAPLEANVNATMHAISALPGNE